jgi:iron complex transport system ATP-binding protein
VTTESLVTLRGVSFRYAEELVLDGLDLDVRRGEFLGLLGPNGSGKTTILKLVAGILAPRAGTIELEGRPIESYRGRSRARRIAYVSQQLPFEFPFTVLEIVLMGRFPHRPAVTLDSPEDVEIAREALHFTDTLRFEGRYVFELSAGERQRVYLARALAQRPSLLLLDEPTAFLDLPHQVSLFDLLDRLHRDQGVTIVSVSHDLNLAGQYCERLVLLRDGRVMYSGTPEEVLAREPIEDVFGGSVFVGRSPASGTPFVLPLGRGAARKRKRENDT